jgi:hypothetical protein
MYLSNPTSDSHQTIPIGTVYTFTTPLDPVEDEEGREEGGCVNCSQQAESNKTRTSQIPITRVLLEHAKDERMPLSSMEPDDVREYLKKYLNWKVAQVSSCIFIALANPNPCMNTVRGFDLSG